MTAGVTDSEALASLPGWGRPKMQPVPETEPGTEPGTGPGAMGAAGASGGAVSDSAGQPASIPAFFRQRAKSYAKVAEALFTAAAGLLNAAAQKEAAGTDAWLPDDDDMATVPPPLGRIAARRLKIGVDPGQLSDLEDMGIAAVGLVTWAAKGFAAVFAARRDRKKAEDGRAVYDDRGGM